MKKIVVGTLAHVDAGKTTLTESLLYHSGMIRKLGRVDHGDTFLDYDVQERNRGITIFSKQSTLQYKDLEMTFIDTPGHVDFSSEMERTLQILDYAIVVISGLDGVQSHSETIWNLLKAYNIPTFLFINKMDISHYSQAELLENLKQKFGSSCVDMTSMEDIAMCDESLLEEYLESETLELSHIKDAIEQRKVFPCFFGSALKMQGIEEFLEGMLTYTKEKQYPSQFGAKVYKITRDNGQRLTHLKITGGTLKVKTQFNDEKIDQIRIYSGNKYRLVDEVKAGDICVLVGFTHIQTGDGLGFENHHHAPTLSPFMNYHIVLPDDCDRFRVLSQLRQLGDEDPTLHMTYHETTQEMSVQLMGEIQIAVLKTLIQERFGVQVSFDQGSIIYKETIEDIVEGVGHFEPLRHYAEVHLLLEPLPQGSGLQFASKCSEDILEKHWQRLIMTHMEEKEHLGVLTGSPITDMKITLVTGRAHQKHTEGGDFRQATYRAIRQGLKKAKSILLEPYFHFQLMIPSSSLSRALYDIEEMKGEFEIGETIDNFVTITGSAPAVTMQNYQSEVISYTKGKGRLLCQMAGYQPCHNQDEMIEKIHYSSESDLDNPTGSVFCAHGAGFNVNWDEVEDYMHLDYVYKPQVIQIKSTYTYSSHLSEDDELEAIFEKTYGKIERKTASQLGYHQTTNQTVEVKAPKAQCLLVDGYNVIHAWNELKNLAKDNLDGARFRLLDMMCNYQGYKKCLLIVVFDAYKVKGSLGSQENYHNIHVVYTKEAQAADMYIERVTRQMANDYQITVATSDALEQLIISGAGAYRMSSRELKLDYEHINKSGQAEYERKSQKNHNLLLEEIGNYKEK